MQIPMLYVWRRRIAKVIDFCNMAQQILLLQVFCIYFGKSHLGLVKIAMLPILGK